MANLKPWQRSIKDPKEAKEGERVAFYDGVGLIASNMKDPAYIKNAEEKAKKKQKRLEDQRQRIKVRLERAFNAGKRVGVSEYKKSEKFTKKLEAAKKQGAREAKPKANAAEQLAKAKARKVKEEARIAKLEAKIKK